MMRNLKQQDNYSLNNIKRIVDEVLQNHNLGTHNYTFAFKADINPRRMGNVEITIYAKHSMYHNELNYLYKNDCFIDYMDLRCGIEPLIKDHVENTVSSLIRFMKEKEQKDGTK